MSHENRTEAEAAATVSQAITDMGLGITTTNDAERLAAAAAAHLAHKSIAEQTSADVQPPPAAQDLSPQAQAQADKGRIVQEEPKPLPHPTARTAPPPMVSTTAPELSAGKPNPKEKAKVKK